MTPTVAPTPTPANDYIRQGGFETPNLPAGGHQYTNLAGSEWTFDHSSGIASQGSAFGIATAPEGVQVAFVQATGSLRQTMTFGAGTYALRFRAAARDGLPHNYAIKIDGVTLDTRAQNNHPSSGYQQVTSSAFTLAAGAHEIRFVGLANIDRTVLLDDVQTVTATPTPPSAPTNLQAVAGDKRVDLTWTAVAGARDYEVYAGTAPNALASVGTANASNFPHEQLTNGTTYYYRVLARNASSNSPLSDQNSATPMAPVTPTPTPTAPPPTPTPTPTAPPPTPTPTPTAPPPTPTPTPVPPSANRLVDLSIEAMTTPAGQEEGSQIYFPDPQQVDFTIPNRGTATFRVTVTNRGTANDNFRVSGRGDAPGWKVRYFDAFAGGADISAQVKSNTYVLTSVTPDVPRTLRVEVTPDNTVPASNGSNPDLGAYSVPIAAYSENASFIRDQVTAKSIVGDAPLTVYHVDAAVRVASQTTYKGEGVYDFIASDEQTVDSTASNSVAAVYHLKIINRGNVADSFKVRLPLTKQGWSLHLYDAISGGTDVTGNAQQGNGFTVSNLATQQSKEFRLEAKPNPGTIGTFSFSATATSDGDNTVKDVGAFNTTVDNGSTSVAAKFSGSPRACAGGIDNPLHKLTLMLHATNNGDVLPNTPIELSFENNVGHNYGTQGAPDVRHKAKIYDPNEPNPANRWKEVVTLTTDHNGDVQVVVLSSDVISQPRLIAKWQNSIVGSVTCDFAAAISRRGAPDPVDPNDPNWQANDTGWSVETGNIEKPGDVCNGRVTMQFQAADGSFQTVAGHSIRIRIAKINLSDGSEIYDLNEISRYLKFWASNQESNTFIGTTNANGVLNFSLKGMDEVDGVKGIQFYSQDITHWVQ